MKFVVRGLDLTESSLKATLPVIELLRYQQEDGREPFTDWITALRDKVAAARIRVRLHQIEAGNFGDSKSVGGGVAELRVPIGPGYRVYFGRYGSTVVILLCGGDKKTQAADIARAQQLWTEWRQRQS
ncbi:MAG TPA: addiction module killer protein [Acetobacteraceae bacterium]|nr:addiction module killer protein [Acetobacteraceae bacterium]